MDSKIIKRKNVNHEGEDHLSNMSFQDIQSMFNAQNPFEDNGEWSHEESQELSDILIFKSEASFPENDNQEQIFDLEHDYPEEEEPVYDLESYYPEYQDEEPIFDLEGIYTIAQSQEQQTEINAQKTSMNNNDHLHKERQQLPSPPTPPLEYTLEEQLKLNYKQVQDLNSILLELFNPTLHELDQTLIAFLSSSKSMTAETNSLISSLKENHSTVVSGAFRELLNEIEVALYDTTRIFVKKMHRNQILVHEKRKMNLVTINTKVRHYTEKVKTTQAAFQKSSSKLHNAIENINLKSIDIDSKLTKLRDSNNNELSRALGNTAISRKTLEKAHEELLESLRKKASISINKNVGTYVAAVHEKRRNK